jgi:hypothetical protein
MRGVGLTAAAYKRRLESNPHVDSPVHRQESSHKYFLVTAFMACELAGMAALAWAYSIAQTTTSSTSEFAWFWLGMLLFELPLAGLITRRASSQKMRTALLTFYGVVTYAPKLLRNPISPLYHDEFAHWRETHEILTTGKLFQPNPIIPIIARFPGLHAATAALVNATGLNIWQASTLLLLLFHVTLVIGIAALAQAVGFNNRTASVVAILYGLNSSFLYFDTQYAYESMAITLLVWTLVAFIKAMRSHSGEGRASWSALTLVVAACTVITHHLSTFTLVIVMTLVSLAVSLPWFTRWQSRARDDWPEATRDPRPEGDWAPQGEVTRESWIRRGGTREGWARAAVTAWSLTLITALMAAAWFRFVAPTTFSYLSPFLGEGLSELVQVAKGTSTGRQLFGATLSPWWEQKSAYLVPVFALCLAVGGLLLIWGRIRSGRLLRGRRRALLFAFVSLGLVYFPSTIFILVPSGAEGARRSWAFSWIGLCMLAAPGIVWLLDWAGRNVHKWVRVTLPSGLIVVLAIALVGGTAAGLDASYRLPGPFLYGSDARSVTPELIGAGDWFSARFGTGNKVITDRYTGLIFGSFSLQNPDYPTARLPFYNLYLAEPSAPIEPPNLLSDLHHANYTYLIVDERMAYDVPELGIYFTSTEPPSLQSQDGKSVLHGKLGKFNSFSWAVKVFQSSNYSIYRLNLPVPRIGYRLQPPMSRGKLLQGKLSVTP